MTKITFIRNGDIIIGFSCKGHSGYAAFGADIVCAAVSSAAELCEITLTNVLNIPCRITSNAENAEYSLILPGLFENAQPILKGLLLYFAELAAEYKKYIKLTEEI